MKKWIRADDGKLFQVLEFDSGSKVEIPLNHDGSVKWAKDKYKHSKE